MISQEVELPGGVRAENVIEEESDNEGETVCEADL